MRTYPQLKKIWNSNPVNSGLTQEEIKFLFAESKKRQEQYNIKEIEHERKARAKTLFGELPINYKPLKFK